MTERMARGPSVVCVGEEPAGLFATTGATVERTDEAWVVADLDLLNVNELHELVALKPGADGLLSSLYAHEGPAFVRRLRGSFAIALWDRRQRHLLLAVDHFGMRRLHYVTRNGETTFASRLGAIGAAPGLEATVDPAAVYSYLNFGFVPAPETHFKNVRRVPPGHLVHVRAGTERLEPFWDMKYPEEAQPEERAAPTVYRLTHEAVNEAMRNVPLKRYRRLPQRRHRQQHGRRPHEPRITGEAGQRLLDRVPRGLATTSCSMPSWRRDTSAPPTTRTSSLPTTRSPSCPASWMRTTSPSATTRRSAPSSAPGWPARAA